MSLSKAMQLAKANDFTEKEEVYAYISESYHNGQLKQAWEYFNFLSKAEKAECIRFVQAEESDDEVEMFLLDSEF